MADKDIITTRRHALVRKLAAIRDDRDSPLMFMEGPRLVQEVLNSEESIEILVWTPSAESHPFFEKAKSNAKRKIQVSESVFRGISDVDNPQGILAISRRPTWEWADIFGRAPAPIVILDGVQDPGNVATILRTAEAAGASGVVTTPGAAHLYSPKALRGAMGSTLRVPCLEHLTIKEILNELRKNSCLLVGAAAPGKIPGQESMLYTQIDWKMPTAILLGQEGQGYSSEWNVAVHRVVHIPMQPSVESLNVSAAAALLLYESFRKRVELFSK